MKRRHDEDYLQKNCIEYFRLQFRKRIIFAIPNAGHRNVVEGKRLKDMGMMRGAPDLFISEPGLGYHGLYLELKAGKNKQTSEQKEFEIAVKERGYDYQIVRTFEEFQMVVTEYFSTE